MSLAFLCPGQGEQRAGMLHRLPDDDVLAVASDVLGTDAADLDGSKTLQGTYAAQLALLVSAVAWGRALIADGARPDFVAGHSVGLWSAAVLADAIDFPDAVRGVAARASAMAAATGPGFGMIAIDGADLTTVASIADRLRDRGAAVWPSNVNSATQVTASGAIDDLDALAEQLRTVGARRVTHLAVSVPAHTPLMAPAAEAVRAVLGDIEIRGPRIPIVGNTTGQTLFTGARLREDLITSITTGVRWAIGMDILIERGVDTWVQLPPGRSLLGLLGERGRTIGVEELGIGEASRRAIRAATGSRE